MRRLLLIAAAAALTMAKPGQYREKEDFQYSRSSTDEGSKSGFYGAQRGNMGGNYERAHNMDLLAQNQMSGLVRQVEGELGDNTKTRTGNVYTAASSRGVYGSGHFDLSNLEGRNFQEGMSHGGSRDQSSLSSHSSNYDQHASSSHSAGYSSSRSQQSKYDGYQATGHSGQSLQTGNLQAADHMNGAEYDYERQGGYDSRYVSQSGYQGQSVYDRNSINQHSSRGHGTNTQSRLISTVPVRVVLRPGIRVAVPVAAQTYDATHSATSLDQNAIHSEAEILSNNGRQNFNRPTSNSKHYESSYNYHKEWEKHDSKPVDVPAPTPTVNPFLKNNELYDETQAARISDGHYRANAVDLNRADSRNVYSGYRANVKSTSNSQSGHQSDYNTQRFSSSNGLNANAHSAQSAASSDLTKLVEDINSRPKSYQSSYSYHKSWERQGDPYVIKPSSNGLYNEEASQRLTAASVNQGGYSSHQYGSRQSYSNGMAADCDCDEEGHIRVARSYNLHRQRKFDTDQQSQEEDQQEVGQQTQDIWDNTDTLGQESQSKWDNLGQESQNKWDNLEDLGQQTQTKWDQLEDLGQQSQKKWDSLEDLGQHTQNKWDNLGQQTQNAWDNLGQQTQNTWDKLEQAAQHQSGKLEGQEKQDKQGSTEGFGQQVQGPWSQLDIQKQENEQKNSDTEKKSQDQTFRTTSGETTDKHVSGKVLSTWDKLGNFGFTDNKENFHNSDVSLNSHSNAENFKQFSHTSEKTTTDKNTFQQVHNTWNKLDGFGSYQNTVNNKESNQQPNFQNANINNQNDKHESDHSQPNYSQHDKQSGYGKLNSYNQHSQTSQKDSSDNQATHQVQNTWDKLDNFGSNQNTQNNKVNQNQFQNTDINQQNKKHQGDDSQHTFIRDDNLSSYGKPGSFNQFSQTHQKETNDKHEFGQVQNTWDKLENQGSSSNIGNKNLQNSEQQTQVQNEKDKHETFTEHHTNANNEEQLYFNSNNKYVKPGNQNISQQQSSDNSYQVLHPWNSNKKFNTNYNFETPKQENSMNTDTEHQVDINNQQKQYFYHNIRYIIPPSLNQSNDEAMIEKLFQEWNKFHENFTRNSNIPKQESNMNSKNTDTEHQISGNNQYLYSNTRYVQPGGYNQISQQQQNNDDSYQQIMRENAAMINWLRQHSNANKNFNTHYNSETKFVNSPYSHTWDNMNNIQKETPASGINSDETDVNRNEAHSSYGHTHSQHSYHNWGHTQTYHSRGDLNSTQSSFQNNNFGSHYSRFHPWHSTTLNESVININTDKNNLETLENKYNIRPKDVGRGDIESGDTDSEQSHTVVENKPSSQTFSPDHNKQYKTPQEIEALSLTKETDKILNDTNTQQIHKSEQNIQQHPDNLSVLSINHQKWLEEEKQNGGYYHSNLHFSQSSTQASTTTPKINSNKFINTQDSQITNGIRENHQITNVNQEPEKNNLNYNRPNNHAVESRPYKPVSNNGFNVQINKKNENEKSSETQVNTGLEQEPEELVQQNMEQQFEDFGQENENLDQQSQTAWGEHLEDLGQQVQTGWGPNENLQQQTDSQKLQEFGNLASNNDQKQDFYGQKYYSTNYGEGQSKEKVQNVQPVEQKKEPEVIVPPEPTTAKPGFWASTKNKISSWFKRS